MITLELVQKMWDMITPPEKGKYVFEARQIDLVHTTAGSPLLTIDMDRHRHLLIPIMDGMKIIIDKQSAGVHILVNEWGNDSKKSRFIDVVCLKPHLNPLFDMIIFEILQLLESGSEDPGGDCSKILIRWRELLSPQPLLLPERSTIVGVIGELIVLRKLVKLSPIAIDFWTGPNQGRYDFWSGRIALEVKTTLQKRGLVISIHGLSQLQPPDNGKLFLSILRLEETPGSGESISHLVKELTMLGCDRVKLLTKLKNAGFDAELISRCDDCRLSIVESITYEINEEFPSLTPNSFKVDALPKQIISLNYQLDLSSPLPLAVSDDKVQYVYEQFMNGGG